MFIFSYQEEIMDIQENITYWLQNVDSPRLAAQLERMKTDPESAFDSFYRQLEFGTAGLRGVVGAGTNRMNVYVVRRAALALGEVLPPEQSVAIAYDTRRDSAEFARQTACALAEKGHMVWLFDQSVPLPMLSFAIRDLGCGAGVMLTASHNPPEYNGFKCFGADGAQMPVEQTVGIAEVMDRIGYFTPQTEQLPYYIRSGQVQPVSSRLYDDYESRVMGCSSGQDISGIRVLYTPLNGAGMNIVPQLLSKLGAQVDTVARQMEQDPEFSTCPSPNPENKEAFDLAICQAKTTNPDIILATDPDCDRIGAVVCHNGQYQLLSGNETGCLLLNFVLKSRCGALPLNPVAIKSHVSSPMANEIAKSYGCRMIDVPVGFKHIGQVMTRLEQEGREDDFIFAFEESCGSLAGMYCRDKDAVCAAMLICEMAGWYRSRGMTLVDGLEELYHRYGYYVNQTVSIVLPGAGGETERQQIMLSLRQQPPESIGGMPVISAVDHLAEGSDVLQFDLNNARVIVRPSGTEPKLKLYLMSWGQTMEQARTTGERLRDAASQLVGK